VGQIIKPAADIQVIDLVLDPFIYYDALIASIRQAQQDSDAIDHLAVMLSAAIAQLDAIGDTYGALALIGLHTQLIRLEATIDDGDGIRFVSSHIPSMQHAAAGHY
jgi:hypothetical protein